MMLISRSSKLLKLAFAIFLVHSGPGYSNAQGDFIDQYCKPLGDSFLNCLKERPHFEPGVETLFKKAQQIPKNGGFHLCHVMSWNTIKDEFLKYSKKQEEKGFLQRMSEKDKNVIGDVKYFLNNLFDVDKNAVAPKIDKNANWDYVFHSNIINYRNNRAPKYKSLKDISEKLKAQALQLTDKKVFDVTADDTDSVIQNCDLIKSALAAMNSAPANLRYGDGVVNKEIGVYSDPMGNKKGDTTDREKVILACYKDCDGQQTCKSSTGRYKSGKEWKEREVRRGKKKSCRNGATTGFGQKTSLLDQNDVQASVLT